ncbi:MAG: AraC family transcriptional regulator [Thermoanaerobaculia bacterium]|nr:AraC family transcriptional regulator [Thermoanaerobaculia bacterium]
MVRRGEKLQRLVGLIGRHATSEGRTPSSVAGVDLFRADGPTPIRCAIYHACVIVVAQGRKRGRVGDEDYEYSPARYLVLPVALPIDAQVVEANPERPFLSFSIQVEPRILAEIAAEIDSGAPGSREASRGIAVSETTDELLDAAVRLLSCLDSESDCRVLAPQFKREILYRVLNGPQGELLRGVGQQDSRLGQVARALNLINSEFDRPIGIPELANVAHMSESTFYEAFKAVTSRSPLQYLKEIRLNRARQLLVWEGEAAQQAALRVGYGSASQFSREFKRRFGRSPSAERAWALEMGELAGLRPV